MFRYKIISTLSNPESPQWEGLVRNNLGDNVHPERKKSYCFAREALRLALSDMNIHAEISDLCIREFHQLDKWPELTLSISHTKGAGAAVLGPRSEFQSLGIDIESEDRIVKAEIMQRIFHPQDARLRNIELWCLKEAVFKCLMNTNKFKTVFEFSEILLKPESWSHSPSGLTGTWNLEYSCGHVLAIAVLTV